MNRKAAYFSVLFTVCLLASVACRAEYKGEEFAKSDQAPRHVASELIVKFKPGMVKRAENGKWEGTTEETRALLGQFSIQSIAPVFHTAKPETDLGRTYKITLSPSVSLTEAMNTFKSHPAVEYAEPNYVMHTLTG